MREERTRSRSCKAPRKMEDISNMSPVGPPAAGETRPATRGGEKTEGRAEHARLLATYDKGKHLFVLNYNRFPVLKQVERLIAWGGGKMGFENTADIDKYISHKLTLLSLQVDKGFEYARDAVEYCTDVLYPSLKHRCSTLLDLLPASSSNAE